jgi:hypothetical protein
MPRSAIVTNYNLYGGLHRQCFVRSRGIRPNGVMAEVQY